MALSRSNRWLEDRLEAVRYFDLPKDLGTLSESFLERAFGGSGGIRGSDRLTGAEESLRIGELASHSHSFITKGIHSYEACPADPYAMHGAFLHDLHEQMLSKEVKDYWAKTLYDEARKSPLSFAKNFLKVKPKKDLRLLLC